MSKPRKAGCPPAENARADYSLYCDRGKWCDGQHHSSQKHKERVRHHCARSLLKPKRSSRMLVRHSVCRLSETCLCTSKEGCLPLSWVRGVGLFQSPALLPLSVPVPGSVSPALPFFLWLCGFVVSAFALWAGGSFSCETDAGQILRSRRPKMDLLGASHPAGR